MNITHDIHCHTYLSLCGDKSATIPYYVQTAKELNLDTIGIADHMWGSKIPFPDEMRCSSAASKHHSEHVVNWYKPQDVAHCKQILRDIEESDTQGIKFLFGGEVEYCPGYGLAISEEEAEKLDFIVVPNSHTHHLMPAAMYEPYEKHGVFMLKAAMEICTCSLSKYVTSLAHPFEAVNCLYPVQYIIDTITDEQFAEVFNAAKEAGIAAEINTGPFRELPEDEICNHYMIRILRIAKQCGCKFTFGSDSHRQGAHRVFINACQKVAKLLELTDDDIMKI